MTNFFPVMRMAMFAELSTGEAKIYIIEQKPQESWTRIDASTFGLKDPTFQQLMSDHHAKGDQQSFINSLLPKNIEHRVLLVTLTLEESDTIQVLP